MYETERGLAVRRSAPLIVAAVALAILIALLVYAAGRPIDNNDFWWHLKMGEIFAQQGPWLASDPLVHTANPGPPSAHVWLFDVALHGLHRAVGFHGLRVAHTLTALAIVWLAHSLILRVSRSIIFASAGAGAFIVISWWRLMQPRPDLLSISAALLIYLLLLEDRRPVSRKQICGAAVLLMLWANSHALFSIGLCLMVAALLGCGLEAILVRFSVPGTIDTELRSRSMRLLAALVVGFAATLLNPSGLAQHSTFFRAADESKIWQLADEWTAFDPFGWNPVIGGTDRSMALSLPAWIAMDVILLLFAIAVSVLFSRFLRTRSRSDLLHFNPVLFGLALAGIAAPLVSIRFLWLGIFPLLYLAHFARIWSDEDPKRHARINWGFAVAVLGLAIAFPASRGFELTTRAIPALFEAYASKPYEDRKRHALGLRFLAETGVEGNLFNPPHVGGEVSYWVGPKVQTFLDGRMNSPADAYLDFNNISVQRGTRSAERFTDVLDRRSVDLFLGMGLPVNRSGVGPYNYTTNHLAGAEGWILVSRSQIHSVYLRRNERNRENQRRINEYYLSQGVPFDPELGLDVGQVIRVKPGWALRHGLLPTNYPELMRARRSVDGEVRFRTFDVLGESLSLVGSYSDGIEYDRKSIALRPEARDPQRRLIHGLLRLGRPDEAVLAAEALVRLDPKDPESRRALEIAQRFRGDRNGSGRRASSLDALLNTLQWYREPGQPRAKGAGV
jgi:hypothetical protein